MVKKLSYFNPYYDELGFVHSIDKVSITFDIIKGSDKRLDAILNEFKDLINKRDLIPTIKENCKPISSLGWTKHFIKFEFGIVAFLGNWQFNRKSGEWDSGYNCRLEFNPNKQLSDNFTDSNIIGYNNTGLVRDIIEILKRYCDSASIRRLDYALDIPVDIDRVICPQSRKRLQNYGTTKYFGVPGSHGRLKIYDKKIESLLDSALTRIEYTFKRNNKINFENIIILDGMQAMENVDYKVTSNTEVLIKLCCALKSQGLDYTEYIKKLNARKKKEVVLAVEGFGRVLNQREDILNQLVFDLENYLDLDGFKCPEFIEVPEYESPFENMLDSLSD